MKALCTFLAIHGADAHGRRRLRQGERRHGLDRRRPARQARGARRREKVTPATSGRTSPAPACSSSAACGRSDAILAVADGFSPGATRDGDFETLELELLVADRDHVAKRLERVEKQAKSGDAGLRKEVEPAGGPRPPRSRDSPPRLVRRVAARARSADDEAADRDRQRPRRDRLKLEAELAELSDEEAAAFRDGPSALDEVVRRLKDALDLITFFTAGEKETRAWTLRDGQTALEAGGDDPLRHRARLHPLRGDLDRTTCSTPARTPRLEARHTAARGQDLRVQDGDVLNIRFNI